MYGFQTWSPCVGVIFHSLPDVNKKLPGSKMWRHIDWPLKLLKIGILKT
jgi:hypothetical protein